MVLQQSTMPSWLFTTCVVAALGACAAGCGRNENGRKTATGAATESTPLQEAEPASPVKDTFSGLDVPATLKKLYDRMYVIGETNVSLKEWDAAVASAAQHIAERMKDPSKHVELVCAFDDNVTPLSFASMNGYPQVVDTLLRFESVKGTLEQPGPYGMTPWQLSNLAPRLTLLVINPAIRSDLWSLVPYMVETPYYTNTTYAPYQRVRASLVAAGAKQDPTPVRKFLAASAVCPKSVKERVEKAPDVLTALRDIVVNDRAFGLPSLEKASETHVNLRGESTTDAVLAHLQGLSQINSLYLCNAKVTDAGLERLKGLSQLRELDLGGTQVTDVGLDHLQGLSQLQSLRLDDTKITDAGLAHLQGLSQLQTLGLNRTNVTDAGLVHLQGLSQLQTLGLNGTNITDAGLVHLQGLRKLRELGLAKTQVTDEGVKKLQQTSPNRLFVYH